MKFLFSLFVFASLFSVCLCGWEPRASMQSGRSDFHPIVDGDAVYVAGGCTNQPSQCDTVTDTFEIYFPKNNTWVYGPKMLRPRYRYAAALLNHKIYYVGGRTATEDLVEAIDVFDTTTNTWSTLPGQECVDCAAISDASAFTIGTKIYVTGGYTKDYSLLTRTIVLDTAENANQFRVGRAPNKIHGAGDSGAVVIGTKAYVYGGFGNDGCQPLGTMEIYDSITNQWTSGANDNITIGRGDMGIVAIKNNVFVMGGETKQKPCTDPQKSVSIPIETITRYDIDANAWYNTTQHLAFPRFRFGGFVYADKLYDLGGQTVEGDKFPINNLVYSLDLSEYDPTPSPTPAPPANAATTVSAAFSFVMSAFVLLLLW